MHARNFFLPCIAAFAVISTAASLFTACAEGSGFDDDLGDGGDAGVATDATTGTSSSGAATTSSSGAAASSSGAATSSSGGPTVECKLVINEVSGGTDDWIELYNPTGCDDIDLSSYSLVYRSKDGSSDLKLYNGSNDTLGGGEFFVIGATAFSPKDVPFATGTSLGSTDGQLALREGSSSVDEVGYGSANGHFGEGSNAPSPGTTDSIGRVPDGTDTNDNSADFTVGDPTPGEPN